MSILQTTPEAGGAERVPLSFNQEFLCMFDQGDGDGPFGPRYVIVYGWRVTGEIDLGALRGALADVVGRHEALRTTVVRTDRDRYQQPRAVAAAPPLEVRGLDGADRHRAAEELLNELERGTHGIAEIPLLRAVLGRFDERDSLLVLIAHHTAVDGWSMQILIRDLMALYAARRDGRPAALRPAGQYQDYARWQREAATGTGARRSREYWRERLGGTRILTLRTDHRRSAALPKATAWHRFLIGAEVTARTLELARATRSSPFITLLAAYKVLLRQVTGTADVTVSTFTPGRGQARFHDTVGSFFNFLPLRTDLEGCGSFREAVERTRAGCLAAYSREMPFAHVLQEVPGLMDALSQDDDQAICAFQVVGAPPGAGAGAEAAGLRLAEFQRRLLGQPEGIDVPDGALWSLEVISSGEIVGSLGYNTNLFTDATMTGLAARFTGLLDRVSAAPDAPLDG